MNTIELFRSKAPGASAGAMLCVLRLAVASSSGGELWRRDREAARGGGLRPRALHEATVNGGERRLVPAPPTADCASGQAPAVRWVLRLAVRPRGSLRPSAAMRPRQASPACCHRITNEPHPGECTATLGAQRRPLGCLRLAANGLPPVRRQFVPKRAQSPTGLGPVGESPRRGDVWRANATPADKAAAAAKPARRTPDPLEMTSRSEQHARSRSARVRADRAFRARRRVTRQTAARTSAAALAPRGQP